jgi:phage terminase small subunit
MVLGGRIFEPGSEPLGDRQERYCLARMNGMRVPEAHVHAGYSVKTQKNYKLELTPSVKVRMRWLREQAAKTVVNANAVTRSELIEIARDNIRIAKQGTPIFTKDGTDTGETKADLSAANRGVEILAKMHGFLLDVQVKEDLDSELDGKSPAELKAFVVSLMEELDPNMQKQLMADMEERESDEEVPEDTTIQ